ncbi:uncharacterized protein BT62DRAFT_1012081 [Guyanagaster necrorhizus]|uniref:Uncharacterized protein n=1 Tax=Guyanagaster necrorhizus TaxID=856835 RepID=A0A9P7VHB6_9AGAR|nr:uncharacterized protein BT62DRAFT_1012081 [Guyanagaster necrorhizus MCA 3950]KAG7441046.1 hypothetical protein BT62DRAFT_1012081 [Guyanagaster necrorhizus MCA 3950]
MNRTVLLPHFRRDSVFMVFSFSRIRIHLPVGQMRLLASNPVALASHVRRKGSRKDANHAAPERIDRSGDLKFGRHLFFFSAEIRDAYIRQPSRCAFTCSYCKWIA